MDYTSLLGGSTGSLGFGGGVGAGGGSGSGGGGGYGSAASSASSGPITSGDISGRIGSISSGGVNLQPTINLAFPDAELSSGDDINPPFKIFGLKNWSVAIVVGAVGLFLMFLLRKA
jgi:hypothetical protein